MSKKQLSEAVAALASCVRAFEKAIGAYDNAERLRCIDAGILMATNARIKILEWRKKP